MTRVLLVRHAEVENPGNVLYGRLPRFRLSERGREQAEATARLLAAEPVAAIYTSPLLRARQTAHALARFHPNAARHQSTLIHEVRSAWQGSPIRSYASGFSTYDCPSGSDDETIDDILQRMLAFLRRVERRYSGQTIVAVSHGDPITILHVALSGIPVSVAAIRGEQYVAHGAVTEVVLGPEDTPRVTGYRLPETGSSVRER